MFVRWLPPPRAHPGEVADLARVTGQRYVAAYRQGGLDGLRRWDVVGPVRTWRPTRTRFGCSWPGGGSTGRRHRTPDRKTSIGHTVPMFDDYVRRHSDPGAVSSVTREAAPTRSPRTPYPLFVGIPRIAYDGPRLAWGEALWPTFALMVGIRLGTT